jgi:tetratricopeptide (TPR) repeat protein
MPRITAALGAALATSTAAPAAPVALPGRAPAQATTASSNAPAQTVNWATSQAAELTRQGQQYAARGEAETATRRYLDAIGFDPTYGPAYLALGALHEGAGDPKEAERAYSIGIEHVVGFADAHLCRARLRARQSRKPEAIADFEAAAAQRPDDLDILRELALAYITVRALPAALAVTRRIIDVSGRKRDARAGAEAQVRLRALSLLVGAIDPVAAGIAGRGPVRRALSLYAGRP